MQELLIDFSVNGQVQATHLDKFDLGFLGKKSIKRETIIYFNIYRQLWYIHPEPGDEGVEFTIGYFKSYDQAVEFEIQWLQCCRKDQVSPDSIGAKMLGIKLLRNYNIKEGILCT